MDSRHSLNLSAQDANRSRNPESSLSRGRTLTSDGTESIARSQRSRSSSTSPEGTQVEQPGIPHAESFATMKNYVQTQIQMQTEMGENLIRLQRAAEVPEDSEIMKLTLATHETSMALKESITKLHAMTQDREVHWQRILEQESQKRELWEESLKTLSEEQLEMQRVLKRAEESNRKMKKNRSLRSKASTPILTSTVIMDSSAPVAATAAVAVAAVSSQETPAPEASSNVEDDNSDDSDAESGDEFFDAVDDDDIVEFENEDENEVPHVEGAQEDNQEQQETTDATASGQSYITPSFRGYPEQIRERLPTKQTSLRPDVSLWAILKNSIGKDLSKITLPVYFNEPTSMLQRMAEDAEYIDLLDKAVRQRGATERILFIAAFAMSNYSSTIGRVAKPFNPLLGETYEYCREDKQFRYISEQVSHHPVSHVLLYTLFRTLVRSRV
ncbi:MAG: Oxysterol-binding protein-domain-containing protein [Podila humilis]|nr:MAG: Oxysterol-binding protein-domain-containing protein [Podila humilis]